MQHRYFAIAPSILAFTQLLACDPKKARPEQSATDSAATSVPAASPSAIVVGHFASLTGSTAHFGQDTDRAIRMHIETINESGGIDGQKLDLQTLDDRGDAAEASNAVARLSDVNKARAILGEVHRRCHSQAGELLKPRAFP